MDTEKTSSTIDLLQLWSRFCKSFRRFWPLMIVLGLLMGGFRVWRAWRSYVPMYEATAHFSVNSGYSADDIFFNHSYYDNAAAEQLATAFPHMLNTDILRELVMQQLGTSYINGYTSAQAVAGTNLFVLTTRSASPQDAYDVLNAVIDCYPQVAVYMVDNPQVVIRQAPVVPTTPYNQFVWYSTALKGLMLGVGIALLFMLAVALLTRTVNSTSELKSFLNLPILATLPQITLKKRRHQRTPFLNLHLEQDMEESVRGLRVKLLKKLGDEPHRIVLLTSTLPGEGKTTISANLALSLAEDGYRVALVDADLRKQSLAPLFGLDAEGKGLMNCLENPRLEVTDCLRAVSDSSLQVLTGTSTQNRHYNLDAKRLRQILQTLADRFDYVIVDTPPCGVVSDTGLMCRHADSVLYVVRQDYAPRGQILDAVSGLYEKAAPLTGCILNGTERGHSRYGYGYKYGYGGYKYGYGYGYSRKHKNGGYGYGYGYRTAPEESEE